MQYFLSLGLYTYLFIYLSTNIHTYIQQCIHIRSMIHSIAICSLSVRMPLDFSTLTHFVAERYSKVNAKLFDSIFPFHCSHLNNLLRILKWMYKHARMYFIHFIVICCCWCYLRYSFDFNSIHFISFHEDGTCFSFSNRFVEFIQWEKSFIWHTYTTKQLLASVHFNKTKQNKQQRKTRMKGGRERKSQMKISRQSINTCIYLCMYMLPSCYVRHIINHLLCTCTLLAPYSHWLVSNNNKCKTVCQKFIYNQWHFVNSFTIVWIEISARKFLTDTHHSKDGERKKRNHLVNVTWL